MPHYPYGPGLSQPPVVPIPPQAPATTCYHLTVYDTANSGDRGYVFDTLTDPARVRSRVRGRAKTMEMHGYAVSPVGSGAYMCTRDREVYLVMAVSCYCRAKTVEDLADMGRNVNVHWPPLPSRGE